MTTTQSKKGKASESIIKRMKKLIQNSQQRRFQSIPQSPSSPNKRIALQHKYLNNKVGR